MMPRVITDGRWAVVDDDGGFRRARGEGGKIEWYFGNRSGWHAFFGTGFGLRGSQNG